MKSLTEQYNDIKAKYPDAILLFRCGDFYETYSDDAIDASRILNITLTHRNNGVKMAGFPFYALDTYLPKLIRAGHRVAICDKLEAPMLTAKRHVSELPQDESNEQPISMDTQLSLFPAPASVV